jgi:hypothetical protein
MRLITHADVSHHHFDSHSSSCTSVEYLGNITDDTAINDNSFDCLSVIIYVVTAGKYKSDYAAFYINYQKAVVREILLKA